MMMQRDNCTEVAHSSASVIPTLARYASRGVVRRLACAVATARLHEDRTLHWHSELVDEFHCTPAAISMSGAYHSGGDKRGITATAPMSI